MLTDSKRRNLKPKDKIYKINDRRGLYERAHDEPRLAEHGRADYDQHRLRWVLADERELVGTGRWSGVVDLQRPLPHRE